MTDQNAYQNLFFKKLCWFLKYSSFVLVSISATAWIIQVWGEVFPKDILAKLTWTTVIVVVTTAVIGALFLETNCRKSSETIR